MAVTLPIGTRKGLFLLRGDDNRRRWEVDGPLLTGWSVYHAIVDPRSGALCACTNNWVYGASFHRSDDSGERWQLWSNGLPDRAWAAVLREGFASDSEGVYFGTQSGSVWAARRDDGEWVEAARDLPPILSVEAAAG